MKKYYLELQGLYKSYFDGSGDHHILKGADLNVEKGETVASLGSSGSGKSTLAAKLASFLSDAKQTKKINFFDALKAIFIITKMKFFN